MGTLTNLISDSANVINKIIENGGELTDDLNNELENIETAVATKVDNYAIFMDRLKNEIAYFKEKAKEFSKVEKSLKNLDENLKDRIKYAMINIGKDELKGDNYRFKLSETAGSLIIDDEKSIPDEFKVETVIVEIDKGAIKDALKTGVEIPGAILSKSKSLRKYINKSK